MVHHSWETLEQLYFVSVASAQSKKALHHIIISAVRQKLGNQLSKHLFAHAWSDCDRSAVFGHGKNVMKLLQQSEDVHELAGVFYQSESSQNEIEGAEQNLCEDLSREKRQYLE